MYAIRSYYEQELDEGIDNLQRAFKVARESHAGVLRKSGEPYFFHPLRVAHLAARHWMDFASVKASILHDVVEDTPVTLEEIEADFGHEVGLLVNGLTKVTDARLSRELLKAETYRKQLLTAIEDIRVLCLKFWDRIDNLQTIVITSYSIHYTKLYELSLPGAAVAAVARRSAGQSGCRPRR